jgi:predicted nucleic acid-binding protein
LIVLDASAAMEFLLGSPRGARVRNRIGAPDETLHVPHLLDVEVANAARRWVLQARITSSRGRALLDDLRATPLTRYPHDILLSRIWELRGNASAYDAAYIVLGELLSAPVVTCDARVAGIPGHAAVIEVI